MINRNLMSILKNNFPITNALNKSTSKALNVKFYSKFTKIENSNNSSNDKNVKFEKLTQNKPTIFFKNYSMPRYISNVYSNFSFPINSEIFVKIWRNVNSKINTNISSVVGQLEKLLQVSLFFNFGKSSALVFVERDEDALPLLSLLENIFNIPVIYIKDSSYYKSLSDYKVNSIYFINLKNLIKEKDNIFLQSLQGDQKHTAIFYKIQNYDSYSTWFNSNQNFIKFMDKNIILNINKNTKSVVPLQKYFSKVFNNINLNETEQKELLNMGIIHYGMAVSNQILPKVSSECAKKYANNNKKVGIICESSRDKKQIIDNLSSFDQQKRKNIFILEDIEDIETKFDVLIEAPFISESDLSQRKSTYLNLNDKEDSIMISLLNPRDVKIIDEMRQHELIRIKLCNLFSYNFLKNDINCKNEYLKKPDDLTIPQNEFYSQLENFLKSKQDSQYKNFDMYYENIKNNPTMMKLICRLFFEQNFNEFFKNEKENISLLTGESGYITVLLKPNSTKQLEERYYVTKFLLRNGLVEAANYEEKVLRIFNSFNFIFDIQIEKYEKIKRLAEEETITIEPITELPIVFHHQFSDMLKENKK